MSLVTIDTVSLRPVGGPCPAVRNRALTWEERRGILVRLEAGPYVGTGEASPLPGYSDDSLDQVQDELGSLAQLAPFSVDLTAPLQGAEQAREQLSAPSARFAFDTCVLELAAKHGNRSVADVLCSGRDAPTARIHTTALIRAETPEDAAVDARRAIASGLRAIKLKIGGKLDDEVRMVEAIRAVSPGLELRVDANRGIASGELERRIGQLVSAGADLVEEPSESAEALLGLELPSRSIALDETMRTPAAVSVSRELAQRGALGALVIKPATLGWVSRSLELMSLARELGVAALVSHIFDGFVALAAYAEIARSTSSNRPHGLSAHDALGAFRGYGLPQLHDSFIGAPTSPGLGVVPEWT